ncbi:hypothetical protein [Ehrlichia muris]|nr:hypothetical protein [Ehrlichia muris]
MDKNMLQVPEKELPVSLQIESHDASEEVQLSGVDNDKLAEFNIDPYELGLLLAGFFSAMNSLSYNCPQYHYHYYDCCYDPNDYFDYTANDCCMRPEMQDSLLQEYSEA